MTFDAFQCPLTGNRLQQADQVMVQKINDAIHSKSLMDADGNLVEKPVQGGWYSQQANRFYPIRDSIICLIVEQAFDLESLK